MNKRHISLLVILSIGIISLGICWLLVKNHTVDRLKEIEKSTKTNPAASALPTQALPLSPLNIEKHIQAVGLVTAIFNAPI